MTERQWVDYSTTSCLAVCSCGWRELRTSKPDAWAAAAAHAIHAHYGDNSRTTSRMRSRHQ